ncbi:TfoX/Sxy family protein [Marinoscillum sp. MHG1-6]|uniref:TfoX/Sxy family protein n=1 Tax=Marinoscillum sp. MHG1-6 TaxID=2959627 RepID=UPI00215896DB|nr:TfoX/Sxy family protein [Marinoscillum sp. MHG1-6]
MAYDEYLGERISNILKTKKANFSSKPMMGGLCFLVDDKMLCGIHTDKKLGHSLLMARIGEASYEKQLEKEVCLPMDFTGRPMKGYIFVTPDGFDMEADLEYWIDQCLLFNPDAKASKKRKNA